MDIKALNIRSLAKVDLHRHLEGALRFSTVIELAKAAKIGLPYDDLDALKGRLLVTSPMRDLKSVLDKFWLTQSLLSSSEILERITFEAVEDAFAENVRVLELRYSPSFVQKNHEALSYEQIHKAIHKGMVRAQKSFPVAVGLIGIIGRTDAPSTQKHVMDFLVDHRDTLVGVDLADDESSIDTATLVPLFAKAKKSGLHITIHSGESPGTHENVRQAIELLGAERIGHGVQIHAHPTLMEFVRDHGVTLELCPYSNFLTNAVPAIAQHPFRKLMENGVNVTVNSDDPGIFDSNLSYDYQILETQLGFTEAELKTCADRAAQASFINADEIKKFWK